MHAFAYCCRSYSKIIFKIVSENVCRCHEIVAIYRKKNSLVGFFVEIPLLYLVLYNQTLKTVSDIINTLNKQTTRWGSHTTAALTHFNFKLCVLDVGWVKLNA